MNCHCLKNVCTDAYVRAEFDVKCWEYAKWENGKRVEGGPEDLGRVLEAKCREFEEFLRDHRSQDVVSLEVIRETADICSHCKSPWETYEDDDKTIHCASCGALVEKDLVLQ